MRRILLAGILMLGGSLNLYAKNIAYLKKSCDNGNAEKCFKLGHMYRDGDSVKINYSNAIKYYRMACDNGYPEACNNLGIRYVNGQGEKESKEKAVHFFEKACDNSVRNGCHNLKVMEKEISKI